jgi:hypothetical protein
MTLFEEKSVAILATYPQRLSSLPTAVTSLLGQVDDIVVVANQMTVGGLEDIVPSSVSVHYPDEDLKDVGKFCHPVEDDAFVFLCDDDIVYPADYSKVMIEEYRKLQHLSPVIGVHGVIYSDFFDGKAESRMVQVFTQALEKSFYVNQLGTGTVLCKGYQLPSLSFMMGSMKFVDVRFAVHCQRQGYPRLCVRREKGWMQEQQTDASLFASFTRSWPDNVTREAQEIAGLRFLPTPIAPT